ncbi:fimbrial protein [Salmonella enterica]|uniref:Fimbrial protein n=1 Tax=Salmonella enterica TaxID=28901 RepID=A0A5T4LQS5_SALER|nr:fimbrial protein [Salmonella enterica]EBL7518560.1 fimbrial protein [Salmonella enterica]
MIRLYHCATIIVVANSYAYASTTLTSNFVITNRNIDSYSFQSTDSTATFTDISGSGLYKISDGFLDANRNMRDTGNHQYGLLRQGSLVRITLTGQRLKHKFTVFAKYANAKIRSDAASVSAYFSDVAYNSGCTTVLPFSAIVSGSTPEFYISSSNNVTEDCSAQTYQGNFSYVNGQVRTYGVSRDFLIDIGRLQNDINYRQAPPDTYVGSSTYTGEVIKNRVGSGFTINYINNMTIVKKPYFESVTLSTGDNSFDVRADSVNINGNLTIPYVINGQFTPYNTITLNVTSANGFNLKYGANSIPYSIYTKIGNQKVYPLAKNGVSQGTQIIQNLPADMSALRSEFFADFTVNKSSAALGDYTDTLTAVFQISL